MANYNKHDLELKEKILRLYLEEGRTKKSLTEEYHLGQGTTTYWIHQQRKECQTNTSVNEQTDAFEENKRLRRELAEKEKEIEFLKKAAAFFAREIEQQYTSSSTNIMKPSALDGCFVNLIFLPMLTTII